jgi:hypothetical protein
MLLFCCLLRLLHAKQTLEWNCSALVFLLGLPKHVDISVVACVLYLSAEEVLSNLCQLLHHHPRLPVVFVKRGTAVAARHMDLFPLCSVSPVVIGVCFTTSIIMIWVSLPVSHGSGSGIGSGSGSGSVHHVSMPISHGSVLQMTIMLKGATSKVARGFCHCAQHSKLFTFQSFLGILENPMLPNYTMQCLQCC